jgi:Mg-chelatase subunit ChlI/Mg-chelatase subunit ChlD
MPPSPFPFPAIVGQDAAVESLLLHAVDPRLGGTLLMGHRGCAKSTLARAFGALLAELPPAGEPISPPFVEVPLGVSEDRLLGSVDAGALLEDGKWRARVGLIEAAHRGVLYIDEINLLPDALADLLLDCAASGSYPLERDGLSRRVTSRFILVGTMNPEEGELRPQLSDRFAHGIFLQSPGGAPERMEIARRTLEFQEDPEAFVSAWHPARQALVRQLQDARERLRGIWLPDSLRMEIAERAHTLGLEGMRAELAVLRTVRAAAALEGSSAPESRHVEKAWFLCLGHRRQPPSPPQSPTAPPPAHRPYPESSAGSRGAEKSGAKDATDAEGQTRSNKTETKPRGDLPQTADPAPVPLSVPERGDAFEGKPKPSHRAAAESTGAQGSRGPAVQPQTAPRILWQRSLVESLRAGWRAGRPGWRWIRSGVRGPRRLWIFLDASRSTGAAGSLDSFRGRLLGWLPSAVRIRLLLLREGKVQWSGRDFGAARIRAALEALTHASGTSPLTGAIRLLGRDIQRTAPHPENQVWILSDGLPQREMGQSPRQAAERLRVRLRKLCRMQPPGSVLWVAPPTAKAHAGWIPRLLRGTGVWFLGGEKFPPPTH